MLSNEAGAQPPAVCRRGRHVVVTEHLRLHSPSRSDWLIMAAAASDPGAQRWLGWPKRKVIAASRRDSLLTRRPGQGRMQPSWHGRQWFLIAVDRSSGMVAGGIGSDQADEVGGWLAPAYRGHRLVRELFSGAAHFAHYHLGEANVFAGTEPANVACVNALLAAGFVPTKGPEQHHLPDGRRVPARWFVHQADSPTRC